MHKYCKCNTTPLLYPLVMELFASACLIKKKTDFKVMTKSNLTGIDDPSLELTEPVWPLNTVTVTTLS
jgi:hypothetical protein